MDTQIDMDLSLSEFYAETLKQAGFDVSQQPDMVKMAEANGVDPQLAALAKQVRDQSILDGIEYATEAERLTDAFKIASSWIEHRATVEATATKIATALRVATEKAVMELIDEFDLDVEVDDAIKIAAFSHLPALDMEKDAAAGSGPAQPTAPSTADAMQNAKAMGANAHERVQAILAEAHKNNGDAGPLGYHPDTMHAALGAAVSPALDPSAHKSHGEGIVDRYVPKEQAREFYHHAGEIASAAQNNPTGPKQLTMDQIFSHARDKVNGVSDNKFLGFAQKNKGLIVGGGAALGLGAMYFLHKRKQRQERERYIAAARQRAGLTPQGGLPQQASAPASVQ